MHQQRPVAPRQAGKPLAVEGTVFDGPAIGMAHDQPRFAIVAAGQFHHAVEIEYAAKAGHRAAHEQRLLLPVPPQKCRGGQAAEKLFFHARHFIAASPGGRDIRAFEIG